MSTSTRDRIISYLGKGIQHSVVASSCGVTTSYISQLLELPEVREAIALARAGELESALEADSSIERVEKAALRMVEQKLPFVKNASEAAAIFAKLNGAKRKATATDQASDSMAVDQVTITIPRGASIHFKLNETNQVIEVEGRTMAPLPSRSLPDLQKARLAARDSVTDLIATTVPLTPASTHVQKEQAVDTARAGRVLKELTTVLNGVAVVI